MVRCLKTFTCQYSFYLKVLCNYHLISSMYFCFHISTQVISSFLFFLPILSHCLAFFPLSSVCKISNPGYISPFNEEDETFSILAEDEIIRWFVMKDKISLLSSRAGRKDVNKPFFVHFLFQNKPLVSSVRFAQ